MTAPARLFVAAFPPPPVLEEMVRASTLAQPKCRGWRFSPPEKLHLTVRFLGELEESQLPQLQDRLARELQKVASFTLRGTGWGVFPNPRQPRVLWLGVTPEPPDALDDVANAGETLPFRAHVTIARAAAQTASLPQDLASLPALTLPWDVETLYLVRSRSGYQRLVTFPLRAKSW